MYHLDRLAFILHAEHSNGIEAYKKKKQQMNENLIRSVTHLFSELFGLYVHSGLNWNF